MKIVLIGGQSIPGIGGIESYLFNMAQALRARGHEPVIICSDRHSFTSMVEGVEIIHKRCPRSNMVAMPLLFLLALGYIFRNRRSIDVVNFQSIFFAFFPGWLAALVGCKVCYTIHSLAEDNPKHGPFMRFVLRVAAFISIWLCGRRLITISCSKAEEIRARYGRRCTIIPCGVNLPAAATESDILARFSLVPGYYYLFIGRIDPIKNIDTLVEAYIRHENPEYKLVIAGDYDNDYGASLRLMAKHSPNIIFVGSVMGDDKDALLRGCFASCLVSSSEGMPISLLEAMAYAKPCIVSDIAAMHEVVQPEWVLWCRVRDVASLADQMQYAEDNRDRLMEAGKQMFSFIATNHTWDNIAKHYIDYLTA